MEWDQRATWKKSEWESISFFAQLLAVAFPKEKLHYHGTHVLDEYERADLKGLVVSLEHMKSANGDPLQKCSGCSIPWVLLPPKVGCSLAEVLSCTKCRKAKYCCRECQAAHWEGGHKTECKDLREKKKPKGTAEDGSADLPTVTCLTEKQLGDVARNLMEAMSKKGKLHKKKQNAYLALVCATTCLGIPTVKELCATKLASCSEMKNPGPFINGIQLLLASGDDGKPAWFIAVGYGFEGFGLCQKLGLAPDMLFAEFEVLRQTIRSMRHQPMREDYDASLGIKSATMSAERRYKESYLLNAGTLDPVDHLMVEHEISHAIRRYAGVEPHPSLSAVLQNTNKEVGLRRWASMLEKSTWSETTTSEPIWKVGSQVRVIGLKKAAQHNGKIGFLNAHATLEGRVGVNLGEGHVLSVRKENLELVSALGMPHFCSKIWADRQLLLENSHE